MDRNKIRFRERMAVKKTPTDDPRKHRWINGTWLKENDAIRRRDRCCCGCMKVMTLRENNVEWCDGYEMNGEQFIKAPPCIPGSCKPEFDPLTIKK